MAISHIAIDSPLGEVTLIAKDGVLSGPYFPEHRTRPDPDTFGARSERGLEEARRQLAEYFAGERIGTPFQRRGWEFLGQIPCGETTTYRELARRLRDPALARAVGRAVGANPLSIICPCHRVVGKDGSLTGYAGGLERKGRLLELEAAAEPALGATRHDGV